MINIAHAIFRLMAHHPTATWVTLTVVLAYLVHHTHHVRKRRAAGHNWFVSIRGPWGTRIGKDL